MRLNADTIARTCDDIIYFAERVRRDAADLARTARQDTGDGYPTSSKLVGGGRTGAGDPVGDLAVAGRQPDSTTVDLRALYRALRDARKAMQAAESARGRALPDLSRLEREAAAARDPGLAAVVEMAAYRGATICVNPSCEDFADRGHAGRCSACHEYRRRVDRDAPAAVIAERVRLRELQRQKALDTRCDARHL